jgi:hypothetical protein
MLFMNKTYLYTKMKNKKYNNGGTVQTSNPKVVSTEVKHTYTMTAHFPGIITNIITIINITIIIIKGKHDILTLNSCWSFDKPDRGSLINI